MWTDWSNCSVQCNGFGNTSRSRECNNPSPQYGGDNCTKDDNSTGLMETASQPCFIYCSGDDQLFFDLEKSINFDSRIECTKQQF